ncbi:MAG: AEC family transporter [Thioalkalivibrio sp.]|nr:AEC family transporter [Thioalkalivibrio sp.]
MRKVCAGPCPPRPCVKIERWPRKDTDVTEDKGHANSFFIAAKLAGVPAIALGLAVMTGLQGDYLAAAVMLAALPPAASAYILATRMDGDGPLVAATVGRATLTAALTLPLCLMALGF